MSCIYCGSEGPFNKEHVIPQFLGTFFPVSPKLLPSDGLVCKRCNSITFSALETEFKEDSWEGITGQQLNVTGSNSVRLRGNNVKMECFSGMGDVFFNDIFPFLKLEDEKFVVDIKPQVKVRNYGGEAGYQVFSLEGLKRIKDESGLSKTKRDYYEGIKERLKMAGRDNIAIFTGGNSAEDDVQLDDAISLLKDYGVDYKETERKFSPVPQPESAQFEVKMQCTITASICRFVAKVAFNYFAYCALQEGRQSMLYQPAFDSIRRFISGDTTVRRRDVIVEVSDDPITIHEKISGNRFVSHIVIFYQENGLIFSKLTFFGRKVYKVLLGRANSEILNDHFGCGHLFHPFDHSVNNLTQRPKENPTEEEIKASFGLFRRVDLSARTPTGAVPRATA